MRRLIVAAIAILIAVASSSGDLSAEVFTLTIDRFAFVSADESTISVTGTVACTAGQDVLIAAQVSQQGWPGGTCTIDGCPTIACSGGVQPYEVTHYGGGFYQHGSASATVNGATLDDADVLQVTRRVIVRFER